MNEVSLERYKGVGISEYSFCGGLYERGEEYVKHALELCETESSEILHNDITMCVGKHA